MKIGPGLKTPEHKHGGLELTLVLGGAVMDSEGIYRRGDLLVADETLTHSPQACPKAGCVCMVVTSAPVKLTGFMSFLNPFLKF
ncbi:MAG: cupin domain-containing protein [Alphaproteobacteria bacterium]|nr:cupin domain-containing protein [Alphaproteobacteria bacterium]